MISQFFLLWQSLEIEGELPPSRNGYEGVFYNYFSIGMDAQVAYGFHHLRNEKPNLANGPIANKVDTKSNERLITMKDI